MSKEEALKKLEEEFPTGKAAWENAVALGEDPEEVLEFFRENY